MKKLSCTVLLLISVITTNAKVNPLFKKFYLKPSIGFRMGNTRTSALVKEPTTVEGKMLAGIELKRWRLETGITYQRTHEKIEGLLFEKDFDTQGHPIPGAGSTATYTLQRVMLPLKLGYAIPVIKKLQLVPAAGLNFSVYNYTSNVLIDNATGAEFVNKYKNKELATAICGELHAQIALVKKIGLTAGPSFYYGLNSNSASTGLNTIFFDAGILIGL
jgi:hypothetical protein